MRYFFLIILTFSMSIESTDLEFKEGDEFLANKFETIALFFYKSDATRVDIARDLSFSIHDFMTYGAVDQRDIYKIKRGETFILKDSYRDGDIFEVNLKSSRTSREKFFVLSEDLKNSSITLITEDS
ncbi:hypothetical protein M9C81_00940 [SAR86 cluster bacterium]|nr:hypothetical protein M9C81_00940 [SAR86 cluster bacterium]